MKVLVTGGAGFIASHLIERLLTRDHEVLAIDNFATGSPDNLPDQPQTGKDSRLMVVEGTIANHNLVQRLFEDFEPEMVIHAAASYKDPTNWDEDTRTNVLGTINVVQAAQKIGIKRLIYFQTALCYGLRPIEQPISLSHPIMPDGSSYAISKTTAEEYIRLSGLEYISFRLANVYGPRNLSGLLPTFYQRLTTNKPCVVADTRRDFVFVNDLADVVMKAIDGQGAKGAYHVSSGADVAIKDLFDAAVKALDIKSDNAVEIRPRNPDDAYSILLDPSKTNRDFGWKTSTPLEVGVKAAVEWYKKFGVAQADTFQWL